MHIERSVVNKYGFSEVSVIHGEQTITWVTKAYARFQITSDPFAEINRYLETLTPAVHDAMFEAYREIHRSLATEVRVPQLTRRIGKLYEHIKLADVKDWLVRQNDYRVPHKETDEYSNNPKETTYTREDYAEFAAFSIATRLMIPIWGTALSIMIAQGVVYPELTAMDIMYRTEISRCAAYHRLYVYCEAKVEREMKEKEKLSRVLTGLASTELADWVRADAIIKRVVITPVLGVDIENTNKTLLSTLHYNTKGNVNPDKRKVNAADQIRDKIFGNDDGSAPGDEDKSSYIENYKMKQKIIEGDQVLINETMEDIREIIEHVDPTVPDELIERAILTARRIEYYPIHQHQIKLAQWVLHKHIEPKPLFRLENSAMRNGVAAAQAIIAHWGFIDIAIFMTVEEVVKGSDRAGRPVSAKLMLPTRGSSRVDREEKEKLVKYFPYEIKRTNRSKTKDEGDNNFAMRDVEYILNELSTKAWVYHGDDALFDASQQRQDVSHFLAVSSEMKVSLMRLVTKAVQ